LIKKPQWKPNTEFMHFLQGQRAGDVRSRPNVTTPTATLPQGK